MLRSQLDEGTKAMLCHWDLSIHLSPLPSIMLALFAGRLYPIVSRWWPVIAGSYHIASSPVQERGCCFLRVSSASILRFTGSTGVVVPSLKLSWLPEGCHALIWPSLCVIPPLALGYDQFLCKGPGLRVGWEMVLQRECKVIVPEWGRMNTGWAKTTKFHYKKSPKLGIRKPVRFPSLLCVLLFSFSETFLSLLLWSS